MRSLAVTFLSLMTIGLTAHAAPSASIKAFLNSKVRDKSVSQALCKWDDQQAVSDADVAEIKHRVIGLLPKLGIPALEEVSNLQPSDLKVSAPPDCGSSLKPSIFAIATTSGLSFKVFIKDIGGQPAYRIALNSLKSSRVADLYREAAQSLRLGEENTAGSFANMVNISIVPLSLRPIGMEAGSIDGIGSINLNFSDIAKAGELHTLTLMEDGTLMAQNQLNVDLYSKNLSPGAEATYEVTAVARCICDASMMVQRGFETPGYVLNSQKVTSIKVRVGQKEVVLKNPPDGIRSYYGGAARNPWVQSELAKKGIQVDESTMVELISFTGDAQLYQDTKGNNPL